MPAAGRLRTGVVPRAKPGWAGRQGLGISAATSYRYLNEAIDVLAAQAPNLHTALQHVADAGWSHVVLDGKVIGCDRLTETKTSKNRNHRSRSIP